jgi:hypothetical protein
MDSVVSIEVIECYGEWFVRVIARGQETVNCFTNEHMAGDFAERQRQLLKLGKVVHQ